MTLTSEERLRRAVAAAAKAAERAYEAAFRVRLHFNGVDTAAMEYEREGPPPTHAAFVKAEVKRLMDQADEVEAAAWTQRKQVLALARLLGGES